MSEWLITECGIEGVRIAWQVDGGWENQPATAVLLVAGNGEPQRLAFSRETIIDYPRGVGVEMTEGVIRLLMSLLRKQGGGAGKAAGNP